MPLTQAQLDHVMHLSVPQILKFIEDGRITFPDDLTKYRNHPKYKEISSRFASMPDPAATAEFADIKALYEETPTSAAIAPRLTSFIARYSSSAPLKEKVAEAREMLAELTRSVEADDWEKVDRFSVHSLLSHRRRYPATIHEGEIDSMIWNLLDKSRASDIRRYMSEFPSGQHITECSDILEAQELWNGVSTDPDLITLSDYISEEITSPFIPEARSLFDRLKESELQKMKENPGKYDATTLNLMLDNGIISERELFEAELATPRTLEFLHNPQQLPDIEQRTDENIVPQRGATDIFLFGIPSSGKTCVLTGLLGAKEFHYDNSTLGGGYADNLKIYRDYGKAPGRTYGNFVTQISGKIRPEEAGQPMFQINLIEMSGEEFAMRIAYNPENSVDFESMGTGATQLLTSSNPKVIFIVIDPSANGLIRLATQRDDGSTETKTVQQDIVINKIVNMLAKNPNVLRHTNAIHFIMTKADTIGPRETREQIAVERIQTLYSHAIVTLKELAAKYSFNSTSGNSPMLFTFSLGKFYVGDLFEYDPADADKIIKALKSMTQGERSRGFFSNIKDAIN